MKKHITYIILKTTFISLLLNIIILYIFIESRAVDHNRMRCDMSGIAYVLVIAQHILLMLLSLPVFLNLKKIVLQNYWWSLFSFFGLHLINIIYSATTANTELSPFLLTGILFYIILYFYFIKFRQRFAIKNN